MSTTRRMFISGGIGASAVALSACTGGSKGSSDPAKAAEGKIEGKVSFQTWSLKNEKFTPYFEDIVKKFQEANPGTEVTWMDQPGDGYQEKLLTQANSDALPDVVNVPPNFAYPLVQAEMLLDLAKADKELTSTYVEGGVKAYQMPEIEGSYGYPWYLGTDMNWWNLTELKKYGVDEGSLPKSLDEMSELALKIAQEGGSPLFSAMPEITITSEGKKFTFATEENVALLQKYVDLYKGGAMPPEVLNNDYTGNAALFKQGKVLWTTATSSFADELKKDAPAILEGAVATARFQTPPLFVQGVSVSSKSKNLPTALALAKFLTNDENQIEFVKLAQGFLPGTQKAASDPTKFAAEGATPQQENAGKIASEAMKTAVDITNVLWTEDMKTNMTQQMAKAMKGDISAKEALEASVKYAEENLA